MDYVYICRSGDNEELRYSIRSVVKYAEHDNIWVVGNKPDWYKGNFISVPDTGTKFNNITQCHKVICDSPKISEDFVLMNDDFFILKPIQNMPTFSDGLLEDKISHHMAINGLAQYTRVLTKAKKDLYRLKVYDPICYDLHVPMPFNKALLAPIALINYAPRTMYGNIYNIDAVDIKDVKIYKDRNNINIDESDFISTEDNSFNLIKDRLKELFPEPTKYEKKTPRTSS